MGKSNIKPAPWSAVVLAVVPGVWLIISLQAAVDSLGADIGILAVSAAIAVGIILTSLLREKRVRFWCLPALGGCMWQLTQLQRSVAWELRAGSISLLSQLDGMWETILALIPTPVFYAVVLASFLVITAFGLALLFLVYRTLKRQTPRQGWILIALLIGVDIVLGYLGDSQPGSYQDLWYLPVSLIGSLLFAVPLFLVPVAIGVPVSRQDGLLAGVLAIACQPVWIDLLVNPSHGTGIELMKLLDPTSELLSASVPPSFVALLLFTFLVLIPAGLLRARSCGTQTAWLVLIPLLALVGFVTLPTLAIEAREIPFDLALWVESGLLLVLLWLPLAIAATVYRPHGDEKSVAGVERTISTPGQAPNQ